MEKINVIIRHRPCEKNSTETEKYINKINFKHVFDKNVTNKNIFDKFKSKIMPNLFNGISVVIMAYGQTSSGKTYTMYGDDNKVDGIFTHFVKEIIDEQKHTKNWSHSFSVGYFEIYNNEINDLLTNKKNLKIFNNKIQKLLMAKVKTFEEIDKYFKIGQKNKKVGSTSYNHRSSRSHTIFRLKIKSKSESLNMIKKSTIEFVDLAGSERIKKIGDGRIKETKAINLSLSALSKVMRDLSLKSNIISYRDNKLTHALCNSLNGKNDIYLICTVSMKQKDEDESKNTALFAKKATMIKLKLKSNQKMTKFNNEAKNLLKKRIDYLETELRVLKETNKLLSLKKSNENEINILKIKNDNLKLENDNLKKKHKRAKTKIQNYKTALTIKERTHKRSKSLKYNELMFEWIKKQYK